jgi:hypothetical protein
VLTPAAQIVLGTTTCRQCPTTANTTCPMCVPYLMVAYCHQKLTPAYICQQTTSGDCMNFLIQPCTGVQNGNKDCSGMDSDIPCNTSIVTCNYSP